MLKIPLEILLKTLNTIDINNNNQLIFNGCPILIHTGGISRYYSNLSVYILVLQTSLITYDIYLIDLFTLETLLHYSGDELNCKDSAIDNPNELIYTVFINHEVISNSFSFTFHLKRKSTTVYKDYEPPIYKSIPIEDSFTINYFNQHYPYTYHKFKT